MPNLSQFNTKEDFNKWYQKYRKNKNWKIYSKKYIKDWRAKNSTFKDNVRKKVYYAIKVGKLKKDVCEMCGSIKVEAHHDDYFKPLEVRWFCVLHHRKVDVITGKRAH